MHTHSISQHLPGSQYKPELHSDSPHHQWLRYQQRLHPTLVFLTVGNIPITLHTICLALFIIYTYMHVMALAGHA